jgi:hypothetical protein
MTLKKALHLWGGTKRNLGLVSLLVGGSFAALLAATPANADLIIPLDNPNMAISGFTGPYATVDIDVTSGNSATVTFTSSDPYRMGGTGVVDLNVNGAYTLGPVTEASMTGGFTPSWKDNAPGNVDGFGTFDLSLDNNDGYGDSANSVTFTLTNTTGIWATDGSNFLLANNQGAEAAAHIFVCASAPCDPSTDALATGYAANRGATNIPEPGSISIFGFALAVLGGLMPLMRRRGAFGL